MSRVRSVLCAVAVAATAPLAALAEEEIRLSTADYDLQNPEEVAALHGRIVGSAHILCRPVLDRVSSSSRKYKACVEDAVDKTVQNAAVPAVIDLHKSLGEDARYSLPR
ncbi:MAG: UrcA family protein [Pseudomonadota bacterium]